MWEDCACAANDNGSSRIENATYTIIHMIQDMNTVVRQVLA